MSPDGAVVDRLPRALAAAVPAPVHAYLLVGAPAARTKDVAIAFAAALLCPDAGCGHCEVCRRVLGPGHPDVVVVERTGASITVGEAREIIRIAARSPVEAPRKVLVLTDFHLVGPAAPALLKTIEEPPADTVFVITAETVSSDLVTIASRCARIDVKAAPADPDEVVTAGRELWRGVAGRLDGRGATVAALASELLDACEAGLEPLRVQQAVEAEEATARAREYGERGAGLRELEERHRRQQRRLRMDELRAGLVALADTYVERLARATSTRDAAAASAALEAIDLAGRELVRNPNETLMLQALLVRLDAV